jgi:hypothetical protein
MMHVYLKYIGVGLGLMLLAAALLGGGPLLTQAQPEALYDLVGSVGAGGTAVAGGYQADVVIGQTAVGQRAGGDYALGSGFWGGGIVTEISNLLRLHLPVILQ